MSDSVKKKPSAVKRGCLLVLGAGFLGTVLLIVVAALVGSRDQPQQNAAPGAIAAAVAPEAAPAPGPVEPKIEGLITSGVYAVGSEVQPGIYRVGQYWELQDADQGTLSNDLTMACPSIVVVPPTAAYLKIQGDAVPALTTKVDPIEQQCEGGTFLVGVDIEPGRYKLTPTSDHGYWERMNNRMGTIANDLGTGQAIVIVKKTDFALKTNGGLLSRM